MTPGSATSAPPPPRQSNVEGAIDPADDLALPSDSVRFAHNSERQFARLLDFYDVAWEYEPHSYVLEWDRFANPTQGFVPDFYLPEFDLHIEITTLNQKLVRKKNQKVRRLLELHPEVRCKVLYQRDYLHLAVKYGLEPPSQMAAGEAEPPGDLRGLFGQGAP